ncbi:rhomboid-domain-containing protein [Viridothelium virens]|uniref:Rhomboid-type serine protease n=1 Tax=Viridothelium virens TaxID=1048519 RepID=A0A6A6HLM8_VIRVR|nr:rhomboid-domain-containing protein [Viridothelium virens]
MAANDYYNAPYASEYTHHQNAPPSTRPQQDHYGAPVSPVASAFADQPYSTYNSSRRSSIPNSTRYNGGALGDHTSDPFTDQNAVPLKPSQPNMDDPKVQHYMNDSEGQLHAVRRLSRDRGKRTWKERLFGGKITWVVYFFTIVQLIVFLVEIIKNGTLTHSPIEIHPQFNPMIGPSPYVLINMGARYVPCMRNTPGVQDNTLSDTPLSFPCPNTTSVNPAPECSLSELCGFSGVPNPHPGGSLDDKPAPNQWFRFIIPIFLHAGIIHIGFNLLLQMTLGRDMEKSIGSLRFLLVYLASGIFGFILGGNFAPNGIASTGCSGALFGILALELLDLLYTWRERRTPIKDLSLILLDVVISFVLGLLPGLDNFSHIGGFLMGLLLGVVILHSPVVLRERIGRQGEYSPFYPDSSTQHLRAPSTENVGAGATRTAPSANEVKSFFKDPIGFFKGRKPLWWAWWLIRAIALVGALVAFIVLLNNFYTYRKSCVWCKYLSCLPITTNGVNWCDIGNLTFTTQKSPTKRFFDPSLYY